MEPFEFIQGYEQVVSAFGCWPSFHDGEVHRIVLDRMNPSTGSCTPTLELHLRGRVFTRVEETTTYKLQHDAVVRLLFEGVFDLQLEGFNQQNVLSSLDLSLVENNSNCDALHVVLGYCFGVSGKFGARAARVLGVDAYSDRDT
jgi:hypothetical protein